MGLFDGLFGKKKKSQEDVTERPMLPWEVPGGQQYFDTLKSRIAGQGVGYRPEILSGTTSAYAKQRRGALEGYEIPAVTSGASARGLGRSSVVTSQIGRAEQEAGRDIEERVAQMALADEEQRRKEINQALTDLGGWVDLGTRSAQARANWASAQSQQHLNNSLARKAEDNAFRDRLISTGSTVLGGLLGMVPGGGALGSLVTSAGGGLSSRDALSFLDEIDQLPSSAVRMSNGSRSDSFQPSNYSRLYKPIIKGNK